MTDYVRITFKPAGASRKITLWAKKNGVRNGISSYWKVNVEGEEPEPRNLIMGKEGQIQERPARMNNHYAQLEVCDDSAKKGN